MFNGATFELRGSLGEHELKCPLLLMSVDSCDDTSGSAAMPAAADWLPRRAEAEPQLGWSCGTTGPRSIRPLLCGSSRLGAEVRVTLLPLCDKQTNKVSPLPARSLSVSRRRCFVSPNGSWANGP